MSRQPELLRRKDNCINCSLFKPIKAKKMCQNCWHKYKADNNFNFFIRQKYTQIKQRCTNPNNTSYKYYAGQLDMTLEEFYKFSMNDPKARELWNNSKNKDYRLKASVDRIDKNQKYKIGNIQWIEHGINSKKDQHTTPVSVYKKSGEFIGHYDDLTNAAKSLGVHQANAWKVLHGLRKTAGGMVFKHRNKS